MVFYYISLIIIYIDNEDREIDYLPLNFFKLV